MIINLRENQLVSVVCDVLFYVEMVVDLMLLYTKNKNKSLFIIYYYPLLYHNWQLRFSFFFSIISKLDIDCN